MNAGDHGSLIDALGGTSAVAKLCNISIPSVSNWRHKKIPTGRLAILAPHIEKATNGAVSRQDLFPCDWREIWPELAEREALQGGFNKKHSAHNNKENEGRIYA